MPENSPTQTTESPIIRRPSDPDHLNKLKAKLENYRGRFNKRGPIIAQQDIYFKMTLLERVIEQGEAFTYDFTLEMAKKLGSETDLAALENACGVIDDYCLTGGTNTSAGSLPSA